MYRRNCTSLVPNFTGNRESIMRAVLGTVLAGVFLLTINVGLRIDDRALAEAKGWLSDAPAMAKQVKHAAARMIQHDARR